LQWEVGSWDGDTTGKTKQTYTVKTGDPSKYKLLQYDIVVIAFLPQGKTLASIGDPPSVPNLAKALGVEGQGVAGVTATTLPLVTTPPTTAATGTTKPAATTPTTKKP
jgi:hypothetical protein